MKDKLQTLLSDLLGEFYGYYDQFIAFAPKLMGALVAFFISWVIARMIRNISDRRLKKQMEDPLLAEFLATMIRTLILIIGLSVSFKILGLSGVTASILAGAGITAFIIGFALRDIGENFLAGILMAFKRPFRVGDFVETGLVKGTVMSMSIRDTRIKTPDGKDVFVPNANIIKNSLINYTIDGFLQFDFQVSLPAGVDRQSAMQTIRNEVETVSGVLKRRRRAEVFVTAIAPGRADIRVSFWIDTFKTRETSETIRSEVILKVEALLESFKV